MSRQPSFSGEVAQCRAESVVPAHWDGCIGAWSPLLGRTGEFLRDMSGYHRDGAFVSLSGDTDWVTAALTDAPSSADIIGPVLSYTSNSPAHAVHVDPYPAVAGYPFTLAAWSAAGTGNNGTVKGIVDLGAATNMICGIGWGSTDGKIKLYAQNTSYVQITGPTMQVNVWTHIVGVWRSATDRELYVNGESHSTSATSVTSFTPTRVSMGRPYGGASGFMRIADTRVYNRVLSDNEIRDLYYRPLGMYEYRPRPYVFAPSAPAVGAIMNQLQTTNMGSDLYNGALM